MEDVDSAIKRQEKAAIDSLVGAAWRKEAGDKLDQKIDAALTAVDAAAELAALRTRVREAEQRWEDLQKATEQACRERDAAVGDVVRLREHLRHMLDAALDVNDRHWHEGWRLEIDAAKSALATPAASEAIPEPAEPGEVE